MTTHYAEKAKELRTRRAWSPEQLADVAGINVRTIQRIERGDAASFETLKALANAFDVDVGELIEAHLAARAADTVKMAQYSEELERLIGTEMPRLAKIVERLTKRIAVIEDDAVADVLTAELKEAVQERKRVEARVAELEDYTVPLTSSRTKPPAAGDMGLLGRVPQQRPGVHSEGPAGAQEILAGVPIAVRPQPGENRHDRRWAFAGISRYDAVLSGGIARDGVLGRAPARHVHRRASSVVP